MQEILLSFVSIGCRTPDIFGYYLFKAQCKDSLLGKFVTEGPIIIIYRETIILSSDYRD